MAKLHPPESITNIPSIAWKNGGGTTRTLAVEPANAGFEDFLWRISMAEIISSGAFSPFPGVDRSILLWQGDGVILRSSAWPVHHLDQRWQPFTFAGEDDVTCDLIGGATTDLNLMVRRGKVTSDLRTFRTAAVLPSSFEDVVIFCAQGSLSVQSKDEEPALLKAGSFLRISETDCDVYVSTEDSETVYVCASMQRIMHAV